MATYPQLQEYIRIQHGFVSKSCWIAHVKSEYGLTKGIAPNRIDATRRVYPCPPEKLVAVEDALRHFGMIP